MPVTKTATRALRTSTKKNEINKKIISALEIAVRLAKKTKKEKDVSRAFSMADRAKKKKVIHSNKAGRIKSSLSKLNKSDKKVSPKKAASTKVAKKK